MTVKDVIITLTQKRCQYEHFILKIFKCLVELFNDSVPFVTKDQVLHSIPVGARSFDVSFLHKASAACVQRVCNTTTSGPDRLHGPRLAISAFVTTEQSL